MSLTQREPIQQYWITEDQFCIADPQPTGASADDLAAQLGHRRISDLDASLRTAIAAAANELAQSAGFVSRFSADEPLVAMLRLIAKVATVAPNTTGPNTDHVVELLRQTPLERSSV